MSEEHIKISKDITLVTYDNENYIDIIQPNSDYECGFEGITLTKKELKIILNKINKFKY